MSKKTRRKDTVIKLSKKWAKKKCPRCGEHWYGCLNPDCPVPLSLRSPVSAKSGHDTGGDW